MTEGCRSRSSTRVCRRSKRSKCASTLTRPPERCRSLFLGCSLARVGRPFRSRSREVACGVLPGRARRLSRCGPPERLGWLAREGSRRAPKPTRGSQGAGRARRTTCKGLRSSSPGPKADARAGRGGRPRRKAHRSGGSQGRGVCAARARARVARAAHTRTRDPVRGAHSFGSTCSRRPGSGPRTTFSLSGAHPRDPRGLPGHDRACPNGWGCRPKVVRVNLFALGSRGPTVGRLAVRRAPKPTRSPRTRTQRPDGMNLPDHFSLVARQPPHHTL